MKKQKQTVLITSNLFINNMKFFTKHHRYQNINEEQQRKYLKNL